MTLTLRLLRWGLIALFGLFALALVGLIGTYVYLAPTLPSVESLKEIQLQVPLRVLSRDGRLIAEYGEKHGVACPYNRALANLVLCIDEVAAEKKAAQ